MDIDRYVLKNVTRHSGVIRPGINLAPEGAKHKKPRNVDFFTPDANTFDDPRDAQMLMDKYADNDGIHRLPIWLHTDDLSLAAPHGLCLFKAGGLVCRALRSADNDVNTAIRFDNQGRRVVECDPEKCHDHISGACKFSGRLYFYVPGQLSPNPLMLPTTSLNSFKLIYSALNNIKRVRGGIRLLHNGKPFINLIKVKKDVRRPGPDGAFIRAPQWLVSLSLTIPMDELTCDKATESTSTVSSPAKEQPSTDNPVNREDPRDLKQAIMDAVHRIGLDEEDMRLWAEQIAGKMARDMDPAELNRLHDMLVGLESGEDLRLNLEIDLARLLARIDVTFTDFNGWLNSDEESISWEEAVHKGIADDLLQAVNARTISDPTGFKKEIESAARERRAA